MPRTRIVEDSSDEEASNSLVQIPSDIELEKALRKTVANIFQTGQLEQLTVKRVRLATESGLGLDEGFFKGDQSWKLRSEKIIKDEAVSLYHRTRFPFRSHNGYLLTCVFSRRNRTQEKKKTKKVPNYPYSHL